MKGYDWRGFLKTDPLNGDLPLSPSAFGRQLLVVDDATGALNLIGAEAALGNPAGNGYLLSSTTLGVRSWVPNTSLFPDLSGHSGEFLTNNGTSLSWSPSAGVTDFADLTNIPTTLSGYGITNAVGSSFFSAHGESWDELELFDHADQIIAPSSTPITMQPGPGSFTVRDGNASTTGQLFISGHVAQLQSASTATTNAVACVGATTTQAGMVGKAEVFTLHFDPATVDDANQTTDIICGFQHLSSNSSDYQLPGIGFRIGYIEGGGHAGNIYAIDNGTNYILFKRAIQPNDILSFKVEATSTGWMLYAQGGMFEQFGCSLNSDNWFPCYPSTTSLAASIYPEVVARSGSTARILKFGRQTVSSNAAANTCKQIDFSTLTTKACMHIPSILRNDDGSMWLTWQRASTDVSADVEVLATYIAVDGTVSTPVSLATSSGGTYYNNGSVNLINGQIWAVYQSTTDSWAANSVMHYKVLTQSSGTVSAGTQQNFSGFTTGYRNNANKICSTSTGRKLLPFYTSDSAHAKFLYSDNGGSTWTESGQITGINEAQALVEPNGTLACYGRPSSGSFITRSVSSDDGATWGSPSDTAIPCPDTRFAGSTNPDGTLFLIGNENYTTVNTSNRPAVTGYIVGNGGTVSKKMPLAVYAPTPYNLQRLNYPDGFIDNNNRLTFVWAHADTVGSLWYVNRSLEDIPTNNTISAAQRLRAFGGAYAQRGYNTDILRLTGLAQGTSAVPTLSNANGGFNLLTTGLFDYYKSGTKQWHLRTDGIQLDVAGSSFFAPADGFFYFTGQGGLKSTGDGAFQLANNSGTNVALPVTSGGTGGITASAARTALGLAIGTDVQAFDSDLTTWAGITPATGVGTFLATPSGANLASALTSALPVSKGGTNATSASITAFNNITGFSAAGATGTTSTNLVFSTSPTLVTPILGTPTSGTLTNCTGLPIASGVSGLGTGVATALATNVGSAGSFVTTASNVLKVKASDETRTSTTTFADDADLLLTVASGEVWQIEVSVIWESTGAGGFKIQSTGPSINYASFSLLHFRTDGFTDANAYYTLPTAATFTGTTTMWVRYSGAASFSASGTFKIQWAQSTSDGTAARIKAGSYLKATKL